MSADIANYMKNVGVMNGRLTAPKENEPGQYSNRGYPYLNVPSTRFYQEYAKYASDYFVGVEAQGLNPDDPYEWEVISGDELPSAQWEHTLLMTDHGVEILTY